MKGKMNIHRFGCRFIFIALITMQSGFLEIRGQENGQQYLPLIFQDHRYCGRESLINGNFEQDDAGWELFTSGTGPKGARSSGASMTAP